MAGQNNQDQFEAFFKRADLDGDGRISGAEAVGFFQGSNLPKQVLAQIWMHSDQNRTGFLGRTEFYNALKLVTVAQSKRELTPDIVKAALYGPAAAKIPPPQINLSAVPAQQIHALAAASTPQMGAVTPTTSQNLGFRGPGVPTMNQHHFASQQGQVTRPPQAMPVGTASRPPMGVASPEFSGQGIMGMPQPMPSGTHAHLPQTMLGGVVGPGISNVPASRPPQTMPGGVAGPGVSNVPASHPPQNVPGGVSGPRISNSSISTDWFGGGTGGTMTGIRGTSPSTTTSISQLQTLTSTPSQLAANDSKALVVSGNGLATDSFFGGDVFSVAPSTKKQEPSMPMLSTTSTPASPAGVPASSGGQLSVKSNSLDSLQSALAMQPLGGQLQRAQSLPSMAQQVSTQSSSSVLTSGISVGVGNSSDNSQLTWPKMKPSDVQKYTKVFMEVDTDRDGRITGEQARNLFLSWRLPREVLKQVWDLSDQDSDSMLSLREFCFALYLMERYREGRPLPATLPSNVIYDETLLSMTGQPKASYGNPAWGPSVGFGQQPGMGPRPMSSPANNLRPPVPVPNPQPDGIMVPNHQKSRALALEDPFLSQHDSGEHNSANSMNQNGTPTEKKVGETEKVILDSKEKIEFYRTKMQDLVLYKSRCDNRLNEITERALADKREAELLGKKYEEKYKQVAEVASKLTIEEATFRDIQARKLELHQAIVHMEQGGSADGILQVRADRIQSDLDELMKALTERCKKHGLDIKSAAIIELPTGWQPGIQEGAAVWDEEWDKFEDEGFGNELTVDVKNVSTASSLLNGHAKPSNFPDTSEHAFESDSAYPHSEDELARSAQGSPAGRTASESPSQEFSDVFAKSTEADAETHSFDESTWGAFDTNDDVDSVWGINPASTKDADSEKHRDFFGIDDFGVKPIRTESPSAESVFQRKSPFFEDSVPATPASRFGNSPRYSETGDHFDNFSGFDSFSMHEGGFSPGEKLTRFDSINSAKEFGHSRAFSSFDDSDPFGSSGPFKVSSDHQSPKKGSGNWSAF